MGQYSPSHTFSKYALLIVLGAFIIPAFPQTPPSPIELGQYQGLFDAVASGNATRVKRLISQDINLDVRDNHGRTPLQVATYFGDAELARILLEAGADANTMDHQRYDLITIAAVNNNVELIKLGLEFGANPGATTSPYDGTALIAAAHLGHVETIQILIEAGTPLDHVNNLGWTALIESIVLGNGGEHHTNVLKLLVDAGANINLANRNGTTPLQLARQQGFDSMAEYLELAGAE